MSTPGIGHNRGPALDGGGWQRHCWTRARADLLPHLPIEVVRRRVRRAKQLGLPYRTYAGLRATTGRDLVALLFSANALGVRQGDRDMPAEVLATLRGVIGAMRVGSAPHRGAFADLLAGLDRWAVGPAPLAGFAAQARTMDVARAGVPAAACLLVGDAPWEREWCAAGRLAGCVSAAAYFGRG